MENSRIINTQIEKSPVDNDIASSLNYQQFFEMRTPSFDNESSRIQNSQLNSTSDTDSLNCCQLCDSDHSKDSWSYFNDDISDSCCYSQFKEELADPFYVTEQSSEFESSMEDFTSSYSSYYSEADSDDADQSVHFYTNPIFLPTIYQLPSQNDQLVMNPIYSEPSTPPFYVNSIQQQLLAPFYYIPTVMPQNEISLETESSDASSYDSQVDDSRDSEDESFLRMLARQAQMSIMMQKVRWIQRI